MMNRNRYILAGLALMITLFGCSSDSNDPTLDNPFDPRNAEGFPVPDSIQVTVGNNFVRLDWAIADTVGIDEYAVFRRRLDEPAVEELMGRVSERRYEDNSARNGRTYEYRIAAGMDELFGKRSEGVVASPGQFSIVIDNDSPKTRSRTVGISLGSSTPITTIRLSEDSDFLDTPWRPATPPVSVVLSAGDGDKTVYGQFRFEDGSESTRMLDFIELDTQAIIRSVDFSGPEVTSPGAAIHFRLDGGEAGGFAVINVSGLFSDLTLVDDGTLGDPIPGDGIYERDAEIPAGALVSTVAVTGSFQDEVGNQASPTDASRTLTVEEPPLSVTLLSAIAEEPPSPPGVTLRWTQSQDPDFASYNLYRSQSPSVDTSDLLVGSIPSRTILEFKDESVTEGETYTYRVYARTRFGLDSGSNILQFLVPNVRPPEGVTLDTPDAIGFTRLALEWDRSSARDFMAYRIFRNETGAVTEEDSLVAEISDIDLTFFDDSELRENTLYHYRVYVLDTAQLFSRSNEVTGRTKNEPPLPVVLDDPGAGVVSQVTLTWSTSDAHDFAFYRVFRDSISTVSTASELVVELDEQEASSFEVAGLDSVRATYFRVFVFDDGTDPGQESAGSNIVGVNATSSIQQGENQDAHTSGDTGPDRGRK